MGELESLRVGSAVFVVRATVGLQSTCYFTNIDTLILLLNTRY